MYSPREFRAIQGIFSYIGTKTAILSVIFLQTFTNNDSITLKYNHT